MPPFEQIMKVNARPLSKSELERLTQWIAQGVLEGDAPPDGPDPAVTDEDRRFWSFRPPAAVAVPAVQDATRVRNPVDAFVLKKLEEKGLTLRPETDRLTLARRAYLDLTGLLPELEQLQSF